MLLDWCMKFVCLIIAVKVVNNARFRRGYHFELRPVKILRCDKDTPLQGFCAIGETQVFIGKTWLN
jgi:hypothetical protein